MRADRKKYEPVIYKVAGHAFIFFFNHTTPTVLYTLSLHDALPIFPEEIRSSHPAGKQRIPRQDEPGLDGGYAVFRDRKSTRLNSSHQIISYAVFCLKKKKKKQNNIIQSFLNAR